MRRTKGRIGAQEAATETGDSGASSNVRRLRGRPSGLGYDPATGITHAHNAEADISAFIDNGGGYRPDRFYCKATDDNGHRSQLNSLSVPQGIDSQIAAAVQEIPQYRNTRDFVRDAIVHRLEWVQRNYAMSDAARRMLESERHQADMRAVVAEMTMMRDAVTETKEMLDAAIENHDWSVLADILGTADELADWLREPYKTQATAAFEAAKDRGRTGLAKWRATRDE